MAYIGPDISQNALLRCSGSPWYYGAWEAEGGAHNTHRGIQREEGTVEGIAKRTGAGKRF